GIERVCVQPGTVEPFEAADLYAKASGYLVEQRVDIGSRVTSGDLLARISVPEYEKQVQRDTARVKDAEAKVRQMEAHLTAAKIDQAAADLDETLAGVGVATAELERSQVLFGYTSIRSPYTGVVTKRNFHPGEFVKSAEQGGNVPLLAVERTDVMRVVVQVPD